METRIRRLFDDVTETEDARDLLARNPLEQEIVFRIDGAGDVLVTLEPGSPDVTVTSGSAEYELFRVTVIELDRGTMEELLDGAYLSEYYLDGDLHIKGLPSIKIILGQLFRINKEQRAGEGCQA